MSNIDFSTILTNYPTPGQDNDTQGFRQNFQTIYTALETAKHELGNLQERTVLKADLTSSGGTKVVNDLAGSKIVNGLFNQFSGQAFGFTQFDNTSSGYASIPVDFTNGVMQTINIKYTNTTLNFINWPQNESTADGNKYYSVLRLMIVNQDPTSAKTITITTENGHPVVAAGNDPELTNAAGSAILQLGTTGNALNVDAASNYINVSSTNDLYVGQTIKFGGVSGHGITVGTIYYVQAVDLTNVAIRISASFGGDPIDITSTGTVTFSFLAGPAKVQMLEAFTTESGNPVYLRRLGEF